MSDEKFDLEALRRVTMPMVLAHVNPMLALNMARIDEIAAILELVGITKEQIETVFQKIGYQAVLPERWHAVTYGWECQQMEWVLEQVKIGEEIERVVKGLP